MAGSIICGMDGSESARSAARIARSLCSKLGLRLVFVPVVEAGSPDETIGAIAARLQHLTEGRTEVDCGAAWLVDAGNPVDPLLAAAEDEDASFIVVGSQSPRSSLLGSTSAEVSRRASCPVVVVPTGADENLTELDALTEIAAGFARFSSSSHAAREVGARRCHALR